MLCLLQAFLIPPVSHQVVWCGDETEPTDDGEVVILLKCSKELEMVPFLC